MRFFQTNFGHFICRRRLIRPASSFRPVAVVLQNWLRFVAAAFKGIFFTIRIAIIRRIQVGIASPHSKGVAFFHQAVSVFRPTLGWLHPFGIGLHQAGGMRNAIIEEGFNSCRIAAGGGRCLGYRLFPHFEGEGGGFALAGFLQSGEVQVFGKCAEGLLRLFMACKLVHTFKKRLIAAVRPVPIVVKTVTGRSFPHIKSKHLGSNGI